MLQDPVRLMLDRCLILCSGLSLLNAAAQCTQKPCRTREREEKMGVASSAAHDVALASGALDGDQDQDEFAASKTSRTVPVPILQTWSMKRMGDADVEMGLMAQLPSVVILLLPSSMSSVAAVFPTAFRLWA